LLGAPALSHVERSLEPCRGGATAPERVAAARTAALAVDRVVSASTGLGSRTAWLLAIACTLLAALIALVVYGRAALTQLVPALMLGASALLLVLWVERLPGDLPNLVRALCFTLGNLGVLALLLWPTKVHAWLARHARLAPLILPGLLVVTYTSNTQPQSYVLIVTFALVCFLIAPLSSSSPSLLRGARLTLQPRLALVAALCVLALAPAGVLKNELYPNLLYKRADLALALALALVAAWALVHVSSRQKSLPVIAILACVAGSLLLRRVAPPLVGRFAIIAFGVAALWALWRGRSLLALGCGVATYAWVSRDLEFLAFIPALGLAELLAADKRLAPEPGVRGLPQLLVSISVVFALLYVQRVGLQGSLDIGAMDWGAGGFRDPHVPAWLVGTAIGYKYVIAELLVMAVIAGAMAGPARERFLAGLTVTYVARNAALLAMLFVCGSSFWTALRVLGDLPFGLTGAAAAALTWLGARALGSRALRSHSPAPAG
jgi:hypothetical protein